MARAIPRAILLFQAHGKPGTRKARERGTFRWVASQWSDRTDQRLDLVAAGVSGDLAYMVGFEHIAHSVIGVPVELYTLRVTHIFRREQGEWRIAHRHADYVPIDQTLPADASTE